MKILLAEDDRLSRDFLEGFMKIYGDCDSAADGMEAIDNVLESMKMHEPYGLLCLDLMLPKVDGLKVLEIVRRLEEQYHVPAAERMRVIIMTAIADVNVIDQAFKLGCDAYASKPIDTEKIQKVMADLGLAQ